MTDAVNNYDELTPEMLETAARVEEAKGVHLMNVLDYAEEVQGLDPIGSSDMLSDLATYTRMLMFTGKVLPAEETWALFITSEMYKEYSGGRHGE